TVVADRGVVDENVERLAGEPPSQTGDALFVGNVERLRAHRQFREVAGLLRPAGRRDDAIAAFRERPDERETDAPVGSGHEVNAVFVGLRHGGSNAVGCNFRTGSEALYSGQNPMTPRRLRAGLLAASLCVAAGCQTAAPAARPQVEG